MQRLYYTILFLLVLAIRASGQIQPDTVGLTPSINHYGDPINGYHLYFDSIGLPSAQYRVYQVDDKVRPVKQVVVLKEVYSFAPADLRDSTFTVGGQEYHVQGGLKVAALTDREYQAADAANMIWGEAFTWYYNPVGYRDTSIWTPNFEITVRKAGTEQQERSPANCLELMTFDVYDTASGQFYSVMCAAPDVDCGWADYTPQASEGRYNCRFGWINKYEYKRWMDRLSKE